MRTPVTGATMTAGTAAALTILLVASLNSVAQSPGTGSATSASKYRAPRAAGGHPDLNGIWQAFTTANWDLLDHEAQAGPHPELMGVYGAGPAGQGVVEGNEIPYQTWALAKKKENFDKRMR